MEDPKDVLEQETLLPSEERYLYVFAKKICGDMNREKRREKVLSEEIEKEICVSEHGHVKKGTGPSELGNANFGVF